MSKKHLYRYYGLIIKAVGELTDCSSKDVHESLKRAKGIETLKNLSKKELYEYILEIEVHFQVEYGITLLGDDVETLTEYWNENPLE